MSRLDDIKARLAAATPGPHDFSKHQTGPHGETPEWFSLDDQWGVYPPDAPPEQDWQDGGPVALVAGREYPGNGPFFGNAWADLAWCVAALERIGEIVVHCPACDGLGRDADNVGRCRVCEGAGDIEAKSLLDVPESSRDQTQEGSTDGE